MRPRQSQGQIRPKISTMPRQKTEAAAYLEIYKLVNEKKRLQQELEILEERRDRILKRLEVLDVQVNDLEKDAHQLRESDASPTAAKTQKQSFETDSFKTLFLEY